MNGSLISKPVIKCEMQPPRYVGVKLYPDTAMLAWTIRLGHRSFWHFKEKPKLLPGQKTTLYRIDDNKKMKTSRPSSLSFTMALMKALSASDCPRPLDSEEWRELLNKRNEETSESTLMHVFVGQ